MEGQALFNIMIGVASAAGGWILKLIWDALSELRNDMKELNREVNQDFTRKEDFRATMAEIRTDMKDGFREVKDMISMLFDKVNEKAGR